MDSQRMDEARSARSKPRTRVIAAVLCASVLVACLTPTTAFAWETYGNDYHLIYGVGDYGSSPQHYWIDTTATDFAATINNAMSNWIYTTSYWGITTPIYYTRTYTRSYSRMDIYQDEVNYHSWWAYTQWVRSSVVMAPEPYMNYVWGKITLDRDLASYWNIRGCIAHEMGHVMGLAHEYYSLSAIMNPQSVNASQVYRAMPDDLYGINHLY